MLIELTRRSFIQLLGIAAAAPILPSIAEAKPEVIESGWRNDGNVFHPAFTFVPLSVGISTEADEIAFDDHVLTVLRNRVFEIESLLTGEEINNLDKMYNRRGS